MPDRFARYARTAEPQRRRSTPASSAARPTGDDGGRRCAASRRSRRRALRRRVSTIEVGGVTSSCHHARGETDDHTWVFCPDRGVLCPGDLIIWGVPNAGNPQKVQRYPWDWADALRAMAAKRRAVARARPRRAGRRRSGARASASWSRRPSYLEAIVERTVAALEDGSPPHVDIVRSVEPPTTDSPWLQPVYDEAEFIVRNVIRCFGGWYSGPALASSSRRPVTDVAAAIADLAGGASALLDERTAAGRRSVTSRLACHLADYALEAAPDDATVQEAVADALRAAGRGRDVA